MCCVWSFGIVFNKLRKDYGRIWPKESKLVQIPDTLLDNEFSVKLSQYVSFHCLCCRINSNSVLRHFENFLNLKLNRSLQVNNLYKFIYLLNNRGQTFLISGWGYMGSWVSTTAGNNVQEYLSEKKIMFKKIYPRPVENWSKVKK